MGREKNNGALFRADGGRFPVAGIEHGFRRQGQHPSADAFQQLGSVAAGKGVIAAAALKNGVSAEGKSALFIMEEDGILGVPGGMDYLQSIIRIGFQGKRVPVPENLRTGKAKGTAETSGQIQHRVSQIGWPFFVDPDGDAFPLPEHIQSADMIEMTVGQQDFFYRDALSPKPGKEGFALGARVNQKSVGGRFVRIEIAVDIQKSLQGNTRNHGSCSFLPRV